MQDMGQEYSDRFEIWLVAQASAKVQSDTIILTPNLTTSRETSRDMTIKRLIV